MKGKIQDESKEGEENPGKEKDIQRKIFKECKGRKLLKLKGDLKELLFFFPLVKHMFFLPIISESDHCYFLCTTLTFYTYFKAKGRVPSSRTKQAL